MHSLGRTNFVKTNQDYGHFLLTETLKSFEDLQGYVERLGLFRVDLGLDRMEEALSRTGLGSSPFPIIHVLGTNGKGSTAIYIQELARRQGLCVGLYTSPHLADIRERISVGGRMASREKWLSAGNEILRSCGNLGLTYFEFLTLLAGLLFAASEVDLAVFEAGLGGRFDATSAFVPELTVFTPLGRDHCGVLGNSLQEIAGDKAAAIKTAPVVSAPQPGGIGDILRAAARDKGAVVSFVSAPEAGGNFLEANFRLAKKAWGEYCRIKDLAALPVPGRRDLKVLIPGRMHRVRRAPDIVLDGAHNPHALESLYHVLHDSGFRPGLVIFSCFADKDISGMCAALKHFFCPVAVCSLGEKDRADARDEVIRQLGQRAQKQDLKDLVPVLAKPAEDILVCGSLYLLGRVYSLFPHWPAHGENV